MPKHRWTPLGPHFDPGWTPLPRGEQFPQVNRQLAPHRSRTGPQLAPVDPTQLGPGKQQVRSTLTIAGPQLPHFQRPAPLIGAGSGWRRRKLGPFSNTTKCRHTIPGVELKATIRQRPADHRSGYELETAEISAEAGSYDQAKQLLEDQVPEGWQMISIGRY